MKAVRVIGVGAGLALAVLAGCSDPVMKAMTGPHVHECDGFDVPLSALATHSRKELRARIVAHDVDQDFPFVVETTPSTLVLVGFTPLGTKAFTLVRKGDSVNVDNKSGPALVIPPRNVMEDVLAMSVPSRCGTSRDPVAVAVMGDWEVNDRCSSGRPVERHIARPGGRAEIEITYASNAILLKQKHCHYSARYILQATVPRHPADDEADEEEGPIRSGPHRARAK